ncbi:MAG: metal ABC transporter permease [Phycisphaerales bacterium]|nr:metal ABC transporter permease [Phycisphaerales bacterium]
MGWEASYDGWVIAIGALAAFACALPGTFLLLRGMSMMGDAISHAVLPGIALGFLVSGTRDSIWMFLGALVAGLLAAVLSQALHRMGRLEHGAAMGVVFTSLFAIGLILIVQAAGRVELDPHCVLEGAIEWAPLDMVDVFWGWLTVPRAVPVLVIMLLVNLTVVIACYKEMKIAAFDPDMARASGIDARIMNQVLMIITAATCVACFEVVGSILVVALLVVPPATARLLSDRLPVVLVLACLIGIVMAFLGHLASGSVPGWFLADVEDVSTSGMMAVMAGFLFVLAWVLSPRHGLVMRAVHRLRLRVRIAAEDVLGLLYRCEERQEQLTAAQVRQALMEAASIGGFTARLAMARIRRQGWAELGTTSCHLSDEGRVLATEVVRSHRLWEAWLWRNIKLPADHVHGSAMRLEHVTDADMRDQLAAETESPEVDPHGKPIPASGGEADQSPDSPVE